MSSEPITDSPDPRLQAALAEFLERMDHGEAVDREAFLAEYPDLAAELAPLLETADVLEQIGGITSEPYTPDVSTHSQLSHDIETIAPGRKGQEAVTSGPLPADFGRYRVIKPLGQGAMGVVYLAEDTQLHRQVALKTSSFDNDHSGELLERFYREARSAANLRHPNICPVYDVGEIQGRHYISLAYIEGRTLATYVSPSSSLHERQVLVLVRKLALALEEAHKHEVVHRDLKPANIMVDLRGEPIIMDFGLARVGYSADESRLTQVGMIVGSPAYMAPEQIGGQPELLTGAADQYSLGVILFELLIGHPPFRGPVTAVVGQILTQPPPGLRTLRRDVSAPVEAICLKMLSKSPNDRFASMKHVADEIAGLLRSSTEPRPVAASARAGQPDRSSKAASLATPQTDSQDAIVQEARKHMKQRDYPKAIEMLQQIPETERPPEAAKLLAQALKLMDEVNFVLQEMEAALQSRDGDKLAKRAQELVKLKPDHPRARQVRELIKKHGPERALQFLAEESGTTAAPPLDTGNQRRGGLMAGGILAALLLGIVIWFGSGKTRLKVTVNDPTIEVTFRGNQLSIQNGTSQVDVDPGEQELTIRVAGVVFQTPRFTLKRGTTSVVEVERADGQIAVNLAGTELAVWPLNKSTPAVGAAVTTPVNTVLAVSVAPVVSSFRHGLKAEIFEGKNFEKKLLERIDPTLECLWDWGAPAREAPVDQFSVRFSGWLRAPKSGIYKVGSWSDDGVRVSINGKMVIDCWQLEKSFNEATVSLTEEPQSIVVEAFDHAASSWMSILWQGPGETALSPIPSEALYPDEVSACAPAKELPQSPHGLTAEYFDKSFATKLATQRVYQAHSIWYTGAPLPGLPTQTCVRYTGVLVPPVSGEYQLVSAARTGMKVWFDSDLVMDASFPPKKSPVRLEAHKPYALKIEHINLDGQGSYYLHWISPGESKEVAIPPECLYPTLESVPKTNAALMLAQAASAPAGSRPDEAPMAGTTVSFPQDGRFTSARPLTEVNQDAPINAYPWITPDGLSLYWTREAAGVDSTVMQATRKSTDAPFGDIKSVLRHARLASVSPDGLEIVCPFDANGDGKPEELCTSRRATTSQEFPTPQAIPTLTGLHHALGSAFSEDGQRLIVLAAPQPNTTRIIHRVERSDPGAAWGTPRAVTIPNTPPEMDKITWPSLASGKYLVFSYQDPTNRPIEWGCVADATSDPLAFANPRHMLLDGERFIVRGGRYCPATGELFYTHSGTTPPFEKLEIRVARAEVAPVTPPSNSEEGWTDLFNGRDLTGWEVVNNKGIYPNSTDAGWAVVDGAIECQTTDHGWLRTADAFEDFDLELKFRFTDQGSSSLILRTRGPVAPLADGLWVELNHSAAGGVALAKINSQPRLLPAGEWNQMRIEARGTKYRVEVNGHITAETELSAHHWAASLKQAGRIGLNNYKGQAKGVAFRDIRIRKQPQSPATPALATLPAEADDRWTDLFNGRDLTGWTALGVQGWRVKDGVLIGETQEQQGWLMSSTEYDNCEFDFEYRLGPGTNGGVFLRAWADGPVSGKEFLEVQLLDESDEVYRTMSPSRRTGALYDILEARPLPDLRPNLWHRMNIAIHDQDIRVTVNGQEVTRGKIPAGKQPHGHLGLQLSPRTKPQRCEFQKLRVRPLKDGLPISGTPAQPNAPMVKIEPAAEQPVPEDPDEDPAGPDEIRNGLKAEIYAGQNFDRKVTERIEPDLDCFWNLAAPASGVPVDGFSVRFSGWLKAPKTGRYKIGFSSDDGLRVSIDGRKVIDDWKVGEHYREASVELTEEPQSIQVETFDSTGSAFLSAYWLPTGQSTPGLIPTEAFFLTEARARSPVAKSSKQRHGLLAEYFDPSFTKKLATHRVIRAETSWHTATPLWGLPTALAARYSGYVVPPTTGQYKLVGLGDDWMRVWIDNKPALEAKFEQGIQTALISLEAGKAHAIRIEHANSYLDGEYLLHWVEPGKSEEVSIPPEYLFPTKVAANRASSKNPNIKSPEKPVEKVNTDELPEVQHGLKVEIFEGRNFEKKVGEQIEPNVECFWELGAPSKDAPVDNFSVRFTGWLRAPKAGRYKLLLASKDGSRLKINNQTVIDSWRLAPELAEVSLELSQDPQRFEVEVFHSTLQGWASLLWQPAGTATICHIPATALFPDLESAQSKSNRSNLDRTGLVAEYFDKTLSRRLATDRVYRIEEIWGPHSPRWGLPTDSAARYTGILVPPVSGQYKLVTSARGHIRVWIDDKPTVEVKGIQTAQNAVVELEANKPYEIRVEILTAGHGAHYLHWIPPGTTKEVSIPPECLFPNKAAVRQVTNGPAINAPTEEKPAPSTISAAERETIERELAQLKAADEAAGKKLLKAFDEEIDKVRTAPKISADDRVIHIKGLEAEKAFFEKHGHIPFSLPMRTETLKYLREFTEAQTDAAKVYDRLIESLTKRKNDEAASLLRGERDMAIGPKVVALWKVAVEKGNSTDQWILRSDGTFQASPGTFPWMIDERRFALQWSGPPTNKWVDNLLLSPDSLKADVCHEDGTRWATAERVEP